MRSFSFNNLTKLQAAAAKMKESFAYARVRRALHVAAEKLCLVKNLMGVLMIMIFNPDSLAE